MPNKIITKPEIIDILKNHDEEEASLLNQLNQLKISMMNELKESLNDSLLKGISYDGVKVQNSVFGYGPETKYAIASEKIKVMYEKRIERVYDRLENIQKIYEKIFDLSSMERIVLLGLYYPRSTIMQCAVDIGADQKTVTRWRDIGIDNLQKKMNE